jgi:hypothetical protein
VDIPFALTQTFHCTIFTTSNVNLQQTPKAPNLIIAMDFMFCGLKEYASLLFWPTMSTQVALHLGNCCLPGVITLPWAPIWFLDSGFHPTIARLAIEGSIQHGLVVN